MLTLSWRELGDAPAEAGIYAWYFRPEITEYDIGTFIASVNTPSLQHRGAAVAEEVERFLSQTVFRYFQEEPYEVILRGPLKPRYAGCIQHQSQVSEALVNRILQDPNRVRLIKRIIENSAPFFSSPLYIGMSRNLRSRLLKHKDLIERYSEMVSHSIHGTEALMGEVRDHSFAKQIVCRKIPLGRLFAVLESLNCEGGEYIDIENILNRIHYPLFGRN